MSKEPSERIRDDAYWEKMSRAIETGEYEVSGPAEYGPGHLRSAPDSNEVDFSPTRALRLPPDTDAALTARAAKEGVTVSELMRAAVSEYLNKHA